MIPPLPDISNANNVVSFNPHQPNGFQKTQREVVLAVAKAEDILARTGVPRAQARVFARAIVCTFLAHFEDRQDPAGRMYDALLDYLALIEAPPQGGVA